MKSKWFHLCNQLSDFQSIEKKVRYIKRIWIQQPTYLGTVAKQKISNNFFSIFMSDLTTFYKTCIFICNCIFFQKQSDWLKKDNENLGFVVSQFRNRALDNVINIISAEYKFKYDIMQGLTHSLSSFHDL